MNSARFFSSSFLVTSLILLSLSAAWCARPPAAPVPKSPYLGVVYRYADAMLKSGRDTVGKEKTGLFLSALDRTTLQPLTERPPAPAGIREGDRVGGVNGPLIGANPQHDENLYRLMYVLRGLSGEARYQQAADKGLGWFLRETGSSETQLLPWGEHMSWDVMEDRPLSAHRDPVHEFFRPWMLWEKCFELEPAASERFARALWEHQVADHQSGAFDRHAPFAAPAPRAGMDFPRHAGFFIRTWAVAYQKTGKKNFLEAIDVLLRRYEKKRHAQTGFIELRDGTTLVSLPSTLSLAIDVDAASRLVPRPLATRLESFARREDELFQAISHPLTEKGGFVVAVEKSDGRPRDEPSPLWDARYGAVTTAQLAMMCVSRYDNTGQTGYRDLVLAAADAYRDKMPGAEVDVWPGTFGQAISLELGAWRHSADPAYLEQARRLADAALEIFWQGSPLPAASRRRSHYETITGADTLALALTELHLQILAITAVRAPRNTIDR